VSAAEFAAAGQCAEPLLTWNDVAAVTVAGEKDSPPAMAATAGRAALARSGLDPEHIALILHASVGYQGNELWPAGSYVQRAAAPGSTCPAVEIKQASNGGMAALYLAAGFLQDGSERTAALITAGDVFAPPTVDRWGSDPGTVYADGAAAVVLSRAPGLARLRSVTLVADSELEGMHRPGDPFGATAINRRAPVDLESSRKAFLAQLGLGETVRRLAAGQRTALESALTEAGVTMDDVDRFVLPNFGRRRLETNCLRPLGIAIERTMWPWSRTVGHLGAADQLAALDELAGTGELARGQIVVLLGIGSGFAWSCAVLEITR
jgi:3-oxoacyl-[acyl-carrier-protein] synthase-3